MKKYSHQKNQNPTIHLIDFGFTGGNISSWHGPLIDFGFSGGNVSSWSDSLIDFGFSGGNISSFNELLDFGFYGGNVSSWSDSLIDFGFIGGNSTEKELIVLIDFGFSGGNVSSWNELLDFGFSGGNQSTEIDITNPIPINQSVIYYTKPVLCFNLTNHAGPEMNYSIYWGLSSDNISNLLVTVYNVSDGTFCFNNLSNASGVGVAYYWKVQAWDPNYQKNASFYFTIGSSGKICKDPGWNWASIVFITGIFCIAGIVGYIIKKKDIIHL